MKSPQFKCLGWCFAFLCYFVSESNQDENFLEEDLIVPTTFGDLEGIKVHGANGKSAYAYLGIPYASDTSGYKRFAPPTDPPPWSGARSVKKLPDACIQGRLDYVRDPKLRFWENTSEESDVCLMLNIWLPSPRKNNLPVLAFIHGGGYQTGMSNLELYDGKILASEEEIIVVTLNYRLSAFGFLYLDNNHVPGNVGLMDIELALKWLQLNIAQFGGNPKAVTISGQSAGGSLTALIFLLSSNKGLFHRAIFQSGNGIEESQTSTKTGALEVAFELASKLDCYDADPTKPPNTTKITRCLLEKSSLTIQKAVKNITKPPLPFVPVIDHKYLPRHPLVLLKQGNFSKKLQVMLGSTEDDGVMMLQTFFPDIKWTDDTFYSLKDLKTLAKRLAGSDSEVLAESIVFNYIDWNDPNNPETIRNGIKNLITDSYICSDNTWSETLTDNGNPVYKYVYSHKLLTTGQPAWTGTLHGDELPFVFGQPLDSSKGFSEEDEKFSRIIMNFWANFVKYGDPNVGSKVKVSWPRYTQHKKSSLHMYLSTDLRINNGDRLRRCSFWDRLYPEIRRLSTKKCMV